MIREAEFVLEDAIPREPTRDEELAYIEWLRKEFRSDPWFSLRFRKYTPNPKRWAWKNAREIKN